MMNNIKMNLVLTAAVGLFAAQATQAATVLTDVTYFDATSANTAGGNTWLPTANSNSDNLWGERAGAGFGFGDTILESRNDTANVDENSPEITTTIASLTPNGLYEVTGYYQTKVNDPPENWHLFFGLTSGSLTEFDSVNGTAMTPLDLAFTDGQTVGGQGTADGNRAQFYGVIGTATANGSGEIVVYINDGDLLQNSNAAGGQRSWYDGVGVRAVPEPGSVALLGLGGLALMMRRRK
jgi:hypothetical protein